MASEAKETARLYALLSERIGSDTTEAMFKYIDNKTERSVESSIKILATKNDLYLLRDDFHKDFVDVRKEMSDMRKEMGESKADTIKWMFIFWIGQIGATLGILYFFLKK